LKRHHTWANKSVPQSIFHYLYEADPQIKLFLLPNQNQIYNKMKKKKKSVIIKKKKTDQYS